jgi:lia operon protein LiaG
VKATTSGGDVVLLRINGRIFGETSGGNIEARLVGQNRGVHLETSGGNVSVYLQKDVSANLRASTSGGSVKCDLPVMVSGKISEDEVHGKINGGGELIELSTSGGNIHIRSLE